VKRVIYKYELRPLSFARVPKGAKVLAAGAQGEEIVAWLLVDPDAPHVSRMLAAHPTGVELPHAFNDCEFVGTVQMADGLVFHVFDGGEQ
jgi:hypothetical protein